MNTSGTMSESPVSTPALAPVAAKNIEDESGEAPQSVADFYEEQQKSSTAEKIDEVPEEPDEVEEDDEIQQENEQRIDELLKAPLTDESFGPTTNDLTESQFENLVEDQVADDIAAKKKKSLGKNLFLPKLATQNKHIHNSQQLLNRILKLQMNSPKHLIQRLISKIQQHQKPLRLKNCLLLFL